MISDYWKLIRPNQWVKNLFVFLPAFFNGSLFEYYKLEACFIAFVSFCMVSSSVYCMNDLKDADIDKLHTKKCSRPLSSGTVKRGVVKSLVPLLLASSILFAFLLPLPYAIELCSVIAIYFILNVAYSLHLKHFPIIDVMIVSLGFVLRLIAGGLASETFISPWILIMTFLLSLFLAFAKRRDDLVLMERDKLMLRKNIDQYNIAFINQVLGTLSAITIVCYILYTMSPDALSRNNGQYTFVTSIFVIAAMLRYLQISIVMEKSGSPTEILYKDPFIRACVAGWVLSFMIIIYV